MTRPRAPIAAGAPAATSPHPGLEGRRGGRAVVVAMGCLMFVVSAVAAEVVAGENTDSPLPTRALHVFPLSWPQPIRVIWWLGVAAAALNFRVVLTRAGLARSRVATVLAVAPFVVFAVGVAASASWATWH